jgi:hypothetical protein
MNQRHTARHVPVMFLTLCSSTCHATPKVGATACDCLCAPFPPSTRHSATTQVDGWPLMLPLLAFMLPWYALCREWRRPVCMTRQLYQALCTMSACCQRARHGRAWPAQQLLCASALVNRAPRRAASTRRPSPSANPWSARLADSTQSRHASAPLSTQTSSQCSGEQEAALCRVRTRADARRDIINSQACWPSASERQAGAPLHCSASGMPAPFEAGRQTSPRPPQGRRPPRPTSTLTPSATSCNC